MTTLLVGEIVSFGGSQRVRDLSRTISVAAGRLPILIGPQQVTLQFDRCEFFPELEQLLAVSQQYSIMLGGVDLVRAALRNRRARRRKAQRNRWLAGRGGKRWRG